MADFNQRVTLPFSWPQPPFHIVLVEPDIPQNTGNIARLCAATRTILHLVEPLGFRLTSAALRRAGLDYWEAVTMMRHASFDDFMEQTGPERCFFFSTRAPGSLYEQDFQSGDTFIFGSETKGLPTPMLERYPHQVLGIPMLTDNVRSLNLANAAGVVLFEALRQVQPGPSS